MVTPPIASTSGAWVARIRLNKLPTRKCPSAVSTVCLQSM